MKEAVRTLLMLLVLAPLAWGEDGPRTGYFKKSITPLELLGEEGARAISSVFEPDQKLTWQLSVPKNYNPTEPSGAIVSISWHNGGGGTKAWTPVLEDHNLIWIGLIGGGDKKPINERMLKALLAKAVLDREYKIDSDRYYLFGYSGGAHVAAMLATSKPELFKGAVYYAGALPWGDRLPSKIDLVRQNRFIFMAGSFDDDRRKIKRAADAYKDADVANTKFILVSNVDRQMPGPSYFEAAVEYLDSGVSDEAPQE